MRCALMATSASGRSTFAPSPANSASAPSPSTIASTARARLQLPDGRAPAVPVSAVTWMRLGAPMSNAALSILIIDENRIRASIIESGLREAGHERVTVIHDVNEVARTIQASAPDVIGIDSEGNAVPNRVDFYGGSIDRAGPDIRFAQPQVVAWAVFAPVGTLYSQGALAGGYAGVSAEATRGFGLGANALVGGGFNGSFALQPFSVQAQTGANIALEVTAVTLVAR